MKKLIRLSSIVTIVGIAACNLVPSNAFAGDFFQDQVIRTASKSETREVLRDIQIKNVALSDSAAKLRLAQAQFFLNQTKNEVVSRYAQGEISQYEFDDIRNELTYLTHSMNQYFANVRAYERSRNRDFQSMAAQNLKDADQSYSRLKNTTLKAVRNG